MAGAQSVLLMSGGVTVSTQHWNPSDAGTNIVFADSNKRMHKSSGSTISACRCHTSRSTGKYYFELATTADWTSGESTNIYACLADSAVALNGQPIFGITSGIYIALRGNTQYGTNSGFAGTSSGSGWAASNGSRYVGLACDLDARSVTFYDNGTSVLTASYGAGGGAMFPYGGVSTISGAYMILRVLSSEFSISSIPSGYSAWA